MKYKVKIHKLEHTHKNFPSINVQIGYKRVFEIPTELFRIPTVGERFWTSTWWSTSGVQNILEETTNDNGDIVGGKFETYNSVYMWSVKPSNL